MCSSSCSMADASSNPFAAIFSTPGAVEQQVSSAEQQRREAGDILARVFLISPSSPGDREESRAGRPRCLVALPQLARDLKRSGITIGDLDLDSLAKAVAERLQMTDPSVSLVRCQQGRTGALYSKAKAVETCSLTYLAHCFTRACQERTGDSTVQMEAAVHGHIVEECKRVIVEMCSGVFIRPVHGVFNSLFIQSINKADGDAVAMEFFYRIADAYHNDPQKLMQLFEPALKLVAGSASISSQALSDGLTVLETFAGNTVLAKVMVSSRYWTPQTPIRNGMSFETDTLLGKLLRPTTVPQSRNKPSEHFPPDTSILHRGEVESTRYSVQVQLESHVERLYKVFGRLLRAGEETKTAVIRWLVQCLEANRDRGKMMARMQPVMDPAMSTCAGDGFFLNLSWIMLKLAAPFAKRDAPRIWSIDPLYCLVRSPESTGTQLDFRSETRMAPLDPEEGDELSVQSTGPKTDFNFITHCFFLTHRTLALGMSQIMQRFVDLMSLYERTFRTLQNIAATSGPVGPLHDQIHSQFLILHSQVQGFKAHMEDPRLQELCLTFQVTTARWLVWLATQRSHDLASKSCDPATESHDPDTLFPLPKKAPAQMKAVPECLVDNMSHFFTHLRRSESDLLRTETHLLGHLITFATVFMGSPQYIKNPHMRANISQLVFLMIPPTHSPSTGLIPSVMEPQRVLFERHAVASAHLIRVLMRIFVDIEFTGDSMEFEAKFQYRIPMYNILKFVWELPTYQTSIKVLTAEAVNYDGSEQEIPILLRFINMMINDATVQLDEGLENLVLIGELQRKRQSEWDSYNDEQKKEHQQKMQEASLMASNRNQLARYTVDVLELITGHLTSPFVLPSMVDRIAAMLNYVLKQLVGPKRRQLNVEDMDKFHFHPKKLVSSIVAIYVNLGQSGEFCQALPQDGRSFSIQLLEESARIMRTLGQMELMEKMNSLIERVHKYSNLLQLEETALEDAPEEFLDPVTHELMREPVRLPTSGVTMDKSNVIRHLLSDGTDPFNRSPLTADMLEPDHQLRQKIEDWKTQKLAHLRQSLTSDPQQ